MRISRVALSLGIFLPCLAAAQEPGMAVNLGRGLDQGASLGWTFKEDWTLRPTIGAGYSQYGGWQYAVGSTLLRSFGSTHRVYGYIGVGAYVGSVNNSYSSPTSLGGPSSVGGPNGTVSNSTGSLSANRGSMAYVTAPVGVRARVFGNFEVFAEGAYQKTLAGSFTGRQSGRISGDDGQRFGATFGLTMRLR